MCHICNKAIKYSHSYVILRNLSHKRSSRGLHRSEWLLGEYSQYTDQ